MKLKYNNSNLLTITPYGVANQLLTVYNLGVQGRWNGETIMQYLAHSTLDGLQADANSCLDALNYLNQKLESVRKTISFWDAYQIFDVIEEEDVVLSKLSQLPNNSSLISNVKTPFQWIDPVSNIEETIYSGDIFIKDYQGVLHLIHATNKGIYVPESLDFAGAGNSMTINYVYQTSGPDTKPITSPTGSLHLDNDSGYNEHGTLYPFGATGSSYGFPVKTVSGTTIIPIVKYFNDHNQVCLEQTVIGPTAGYFIITNPTPIPLDYEVR